MRGFKSLNPKSLPEGFDLEVYPRTSRGSQGSEGKIVVNFAFRGFYLIDATRQLAGKRRELKHIQTPLMQSIQYCMPKKTRPTIGRKKTTASELYSALSA